MNENKSLPSDSNQISNILAHRKIFYQSQLSLKHLNTVKIKSKINTLKYKLLNENLIKIVHL